MESTGEALSVSYAILQTVTDAPAPTITMSQFVLNADHRTSSDKTTKPVKKYVMQTTAANAHTIVHNSAKYAILTTTSSL